MDKLIDALYKKIFILLAIAGGNWVYMIKFFENGNYWLSIPLFLVFVLVGSIILKNYVQMNKIIKRMMEHENGG